MGGSQPLPYEKTMFEVGNKGARICAPTKDALGEFVDDVGDAAVAGFL